MADFDISTLETLQPSWQGDTHAAARASLQDYVARWLERPQPKRSQPKRPQPEHAALLMSKAWQLGALDTCVQVCDDILSRQVEFSATPSTTFSTTIRKGACLIRLGRLAEAVTVLAPLREVEEVELSGYALLQLGNAFRYQGNRADAREVLTMALEQAEQRRDGGLVIAVRTALGEVALDEGALETAIEMLGKALGLTEFFSDKRLTVAPLGALAHAHGSWKNPSKAFDLAERAVTRAHPPVDRAGAARAKLASALAAVVREPRQQQTAYTFAAAQMDAGNAPHIPLALRIAVADMTQRVKDPRDVVTPEEGQGWLEQAKRSGMHPETQQLTQLVAQLAG